MKVLRTTVVLTLAIAVFALAAGIDGKWVATAKTKTKGGEEVDTKITLDLKAAGGVITGTVLQSMGDREGRAVEIKDGKLDGNKFNFTTVNQSQRGEMKFNWSGTVEGDTLTGNRVREGGQGQGLAFTAKRQ